MAMIAGASRPSASYQVSVGAFEGPFDLLLHLIARHKVDIYEVALAQITDDYLAVLRGIDVVDLEVATEFLVVAATLIELKAARLLPGEVDDDLDALTLDARDLLYARLLEYRTFKEAAAALRERFAANHGFTPRAVALEPAFAALRPAVPLPLTAAELAALAARVLARPPPPTVDLSHVQPVRMTVPEAATLVIDELDRAGRPLPFRELAAGCRHQAEVVVVFLALLELYKHDTVDLAQTASFGDLIVTWTPEHASAWLPDAAAETSTVDPADSR